MRLLISALIVLGLAPADGPRFTVIVPASAHGDAITGRVYVAISKTNERPPIDQADTNGVPLFAVNIDALAPDTAATIDADALGHPLKSLRDLPAGDYFAQPFVNVYTRFARADGHTVWLHMDQWEGQNWKRSPGNLYGDPVKVRVDPKRHIANEGSVSVVDLESGQAAKQIIVGLLPSAIVATPDGKFVIVANANSDSVSVIDTETNKKLTDITVGELPWGVVIR